MHPRRLATRHHLLALALLAVATSAAATDPRFVSLRPGPATGEWLVLVAGARAEDRLTFTADGAPVASTIEGAAGGVLTARLSGVTAGAERLELAAGPGRPPAAALRLAPVDVAAAPFADWTIYQVMVGMFRNGAAGNDGEIRGWRHPNYAGGDLQGLLEKADYLRELGVTAVWLSPIFAARSSHGYDVTNYYRIADQVAVPGDPEASLALFRQLRQGLSERGIHTILDLPLNHASRSYDRSAGDPRRLKPSSTGPRQEAEKVWEGWGSGYRYWNFDDADTRRFLDGVALHWLVDEGVDGLRLDYVRGVPHDFWAELYREVKAARPGAFLVGECWADAQGAEGNAREIAAYYQPVAGVGPQFDSLLDFPLQGVMTEVFARGGAAEDLEAWLQATDALYGPGALPTYFLDNHDVARFAAWAGDDDRLTAAVGFMASLTGPVVLFYGTETGLTSPAPKPGFTDSGRVPMPWDRLDARLHDRIAAILAARKAHPALGLGARVPLVADREALVMAKVASDEVALVGVNLAASPREVEIDLTGWVPAGAAFTTAVGEAFPRATEGRWRWTLPPRSTSIAVTGLSRPSPSP
jgi:glycosidase